MTDVIKVRKEVQLFRDSIGKLVTLLSGRNIRVTESGKDAFCQWSSEGVLLRINLPSIPDDASDRLLFSMQGFVDHEVAHVLYTDPICAEILKGKMGHHMWNVVEDIFIERRMSAAFPGCRRNLIKVHAHIVERTFEVEADDSLRLNGATRKLFVELFLMPACRSMAGHPVYADFMEAYWPSFPTEKALLESIDFPSRVRRVNSTSQCAALAADLLNVLKTPASEDDSGEGDEPGESLGKKAIVKIGEGTGEGKPFNPEDYDEVEYVDELPEPTPDGESSDEPEPSEKPEDGATGEETKGEEGVEGDKGTGDVEAPCREMTEDDLKILDSEEVETRSVEDATKKLIRDEVSAFSPSAYIPHSRDFDYIGRPEDFDSFVKARRTPDWKFTRSLSEWHVNPAHGSYLFQTVIEPYLGARTSTLAKELERAVVSRNRVQYIAGRKKGKLHGPSLYRLSVEDDRVFRTRQDSRALNACVQIIVDMSGSMDGQRIRIALASAWALADALDKIRVPNMVSGFTTAGEIHGGAASSRAEPLMMPILKDWNERATSDQVRSRIGTAQSLPLSNNVDGECVLALSRLMAPRKEDRKIIIVMSDGQPAAIARGLSDHLKHVVQHLEKTMGYDLLGIGIQTDAPSRYYTHSVKIDTVTDLPKVVASALQKILTQGEF